MEDISSIWRDPKFWCNLASNLEKASSWMWKRLLNKAASSTFDGRTSGGVSPIFDALSLEKVDLLVTDSISES